MRKQFDKFSKEGIKARQRGDYAKALELFTKAELLGEKYKSDEHIMVAKVNMGTVYQQLSNYGDALENYREGLAIADKHPQLKERSLTILNNISNMYAHEEEHTLALQYYKKAYETAKEMNSGYNMLLTAVNMSGLYNTLGDYREARKYLEEVKPLLKTAANQGNTHEVKRVYHINYAETFLVEGRPEEALKILEGAAGNIDSKNENVCYICAAKLLARIYSKMGQPALAIKHAKDGLVHVRSLKEKIDLYSQLSHIYLGQKQYTTAFKYKDSVVMVKDSVAARVSTGLYEANKVKLRIHDYQKEVRHNKEKQESERMLFLLFIALGLLLFLFVYLGLRNRIIKQKQEKIIAGNRQKIIDLEMENLTNTIAEKNRKLSAKALYLSNRNELIEDMIDALARIPEIASNKDISGHIDTLRGHIRTDAEWEDFITYFEQVNPNFLKTLQENHPQLTPADIRFICYLYMNLDLKEISSIFGITIEAAKKRKQRIAKKMELEMDDLHNYLLRLT